MSFDKTAYFGTLENLAFRRVPKVQGRNTESLRRKDRADFLSLYIVFFRAAVRRLIFLEVKLCNSFLTAC